MFLQFDIWFIQIDMITAMSEYLAGTVAIVLNISKQQLIQTSLNIPVITLDFVLARTSCSSSFNYSLFKGLFSRKLCICSVSNCGCSVLARAQFLNDIEGLLGGRTGPTGFCVASLLILSILFVIESLSLTRIFVFM